MNETRTLAEFISDNFWGRRITVLCARFVYYGTVDYVGPNVLVLEDAAKVDVIGSVGDEQPAEESALPNKLILRLDALEIGMVTAWGKQPPRPSVRPNPPYGEETFVDYVRERYIGKEISFLCARYFYYGRLKSISQNMAVLEDAAISEVIRGLMGEHPEVTDNIADPLLINLGAVEFVTVPNWAQGLDKRHRDLI